MTSLTFCSVARHLHDSAVCQAPGSLPHTSWESNPGRTACLPVSLSLHSQSGTWARTHSCDQNPILFFSFGIWNSVTSLHGNTVRANSAARLCSCQKVHAWISDPKFFPKAGAHPVPPHFSKVQPTQEPVFLWFACLLGHAPISICWISLVLNTCPVPLFCLYEISRSPVLSGHHPPLCCWIRIFFFLSFFFVRKIGPELTSVANLPPFAWGRLSLS